MTDDVDGRTARLDESIRLGKEIGADGGAPLGRTLEARMVQATTMATEGAYRVFKRLLEAHGLRYALYSILRLTDYRYISVFRLQDGTIRSVAHVDRENLATLEAGQSSESNSYCCYVRSGDGPFTLVDSTIDARVAGHVKRQDLRAYCGMPITSDDGGLIGTLCHYDTVPRDPGQLNTRLLTLVSDEIGRARLLA